MGECYRLGITRTIGVPEDAPDQVVLFVAGRIADTLRQVRPAFTGLRGNSIMVCVERAERSEVFLINDAPDEDMLDVASQSDRPPSPKTISANFLQVVCYVWRDGHRITAYNAVARAAPDAPKEPSARVPETKSTGECVSGTGASAAPALHAGGSPTAPSTDEAPTVRDWVLPPPSILPPLISPPHKVDLTMTDALGRELRLIVADAQTADARFKSRCAEIKRRLSPDTVAPMVAAALRDTPDGKRSQSIVLEFASTFAILRTLEGKVQPYDAPRTCFVLLESPSPESGAVLVRIVHVCALSRIDALLVDQTVAHASVQCSAETKSV